MSWQTLPLYEWEKNKEAYEQAVFSYMDPLAKMFFGETLCFEELAFYKPSFQTVIPTNDTIQYFNHLLIIGALELLENKCTL